MNNLERSSLYQLTMVRFRLLAREPEAIFWIFIFPILLAAGLGIAFRNRPADVLPVAATTPQLTLALAADKGLNAAEMDEAAGRNALSTGSILLLAVAQPGGVVYEYDDTNPDARQARLLVDRAVQVAAGQRRQVESMLTGKLHSPGDIWRFGPPLADLLNDSGDVDPGKVEAARQAIVSDHPYVAPNPAAPASTVTAADKIDYDDNTPSFADLLKVAAHGSRGVTTE